jgi:hypothetical protein
MSVSSFGFSIFRKKISATRRGKRKRRRIQRERRLLHQPLVKKLWLGRGVALRGWRERQKASLSAHRSYHFKAGDAFC